ncbi:MAG: hypothetical protein IPI11_04560 [Haliscomenobacter sp.]|nr:hypothetical protein [Haliscomenobacter sp.]
MYIKENVQEGYVHGVEGDFNVAVTSRWNVQGALSWQYGQNVSRNEPQRRIPPMFGRGAVSYAYNGISLTAETLFASKQDRLAAGDKSDNRIPAGAPRVGRCSIFTAPIPGTPLPCVPGSGISEMRTTATMDQGRMPWGGVRAWRLR